MSDAVGTGGQRERQAPEPAPAREPPPAVEGARITGRVTDFTGLPLTGVRVEAVATGGGDLDLLPTLTDGQGRFVLEGLAGGKYDLRFVLGTVRARTLWVPAGTEGLEVRLARPLGILFVAKVLDGDALPDVLHVVLLRETETGLRREHVGRHLATRMLLWGMRPGRYTAVAWGGPWLPVEAGGIDLDPEQPTPEVQVLLSGRGVEVAGRVLYREGRPVPGALVAWRRLDRADPRPRDLATAEADEGGAFVLRGLPEGRILVSAGPSGGPFVDREMTLALPAASATSGAAGAATSPPPAPIELRLP